MALNTKLVICNHCAMQYLFLLGTALSFNSHDENGIFCSWRVIERAFSAHLLIILQFFKQGLGKHTNFELLYM